MVRGELSDREAPMVPRIVAVDLFCGGGGMDVGRKAGGDRRAIRGGTVSICGGNLPTELSRHRPSMLETYATSFRYPINQKERKPLCSAAPPVKDSQHRTNAQGTPRTRTTGCTKN